MITLALFNQMLADDVAGLIGDVDNPKRNFYWEEAPLKQNGEPASGVWLVTRGGAADNSRKELNLHTTVDFYVSFQDKARTEWVQAQIIAYITNKRYFCRLKGHVDQFNYNYTNVRIRPTQTPQNAGATENGLIVKVASAELIYDVDNVTPNPPATDEEILMTESQTAISTENKKLLIKE